MMQDSEIDKAFEAVNTIKKIAAKSNKKLSRAETVALLQKILVDNSKILDMINEIAGAVPPEGMTQLDLLVERLNEGASRESKKI